MYVIFRVKTLVQIIIVGSICNELSLILADGTSRPEGGLRLLITTIDTSQHNSTYKQQGATVLVLLSHSICSIFVTCNEL